MPDAPLIRPDRMELLTTRERIPERVRRLEKAVSGGVVGSGGGGGGGSGALIGFHAHRNNVTQAVLTTTWTKVLLTTEEFDVGGYFDTSTSRYTPPAGYYRFSGQVGISTNTVRLTMTLYKNGVEYKRLWDTGGNANSFTMAAGSAVVAANGTDYFELYVWTNSASTVDGAPLYTWFCAERADGPQGTPGTPGAAGTPGGVIYYEQATDPGAVANGALWVDTDDVPPVWSGPQRVTSLPSSPIDGQEIIYVADATKGVLWHLKYNLGSASAYKWEFIGGSSLDAFVQTSEATTSTSYVDLATVGPSVTLALAGDYALEYGFGAFAGANQTLDMDGSPRIAATAASDLDLAFISAVGTGSSASGSISTRRVKTAIAASSLVKLQYKLSSAGTGTFHRRWLKATPIRVG